MGKASFGDRRQREEMLPHSFLAFAASLAGKKMGTRHGKKRRSSRLGKPIVSFPKSQIPGLDGNLAYREAPAVGNDDDV
ncbi:MAG TPA: hypothetical protein VJB12_05045 [Candidatus Nanoarchaeia archaeon]|nr:hypothetical protein [Candidatus Nanoarchaeia archaeon]